MREKEKSNVENRLCAKARRECTEERHSETSLENDVDEDMQIAAQEELKRIFG